MAAWKKNSVCSLLMKYYKSVHNIQVPLKDTRFVEVLHPPVWSPCWAPQQCRLLNYQFQSQPLSCSAIHLKSCSHDCGSISLWMCLSLKWNIDIYQDVYLTPNTSCKEKVFADIVQELYPAPSATCCVAEYTPRSCSCQDLPHYMKCGLSHL